MSVSTAIIAQQIHADIASCEALLSLFLKERDTLKARDAEQLDIIIQEKTTLLSQLENSAKLRTQWSRAHAAGTLEQSWEGMIDELRDTDLKQKWERLKTLFAECKKENEVNGRLLARNQQVFGRLLEIVRGQTQAPSLYSAKGAASGYSGSNRFGEA